MRIHIDDEFKNLIPTLSNEEYGQLEQNIIAEGCRDALAVWFDWDHYYSLKCDCGRTLNFSDETNNEHYIGYCTRCNTQALFRKEFVLLDGHNRYEICTRHSIEFKTVELELDNREQAINWIIDNQLGRRNITKEQRDYLIGVRYRQEKMSHGGDRKSEESREQNVPLIPTAEKIAQQHGISHMAVKRAEKFANGLDKIAEVAPEVKQEILNGKSDFTKTEVMSLANAEHEVVTEKLEEKKKPHVANNAGNNEWYTPVEYIEAARMVMGEIELDPASSELANQTVQAGRFFTALDNGLKHDWYGKVWMNPPYASELIGQFCNKLAMHYYEGDVSESIVLVNNATETAWFNLLIEYASAVVFPKGRVKFYAPDGTLAAPLQGQAVIYLGKQPDRFVQHFNVFGWGAVL